jgi:tripartite-type tricarboxylate transporter receptor subunit TctC
MLWASKSPDGCRTGLEKENSGGWVVKPLLRVIVLALLSVVPASAQTDYPTRTVRFIVSASAGGGTDIIARMVAQQLSAMWGQAVIVENKTGAAGNTSAQLVARARPDGTTLFATFGGVLTINPHLFKELGFDADKDFVPITSLASSAFVLSVNPNVPARSVKELIAYARSRLPTRLNWGSTNKGSPDHLSGELFSIMSGVPMTHIPYRGGADALLDVLGDRVPVAYISIPAGLAHFQSGKLIPLGVTNSVRSPLLPDVPTISEAGLPGFDVQTWFGVWAPAGTPAPIVEKIYAGIRAVLDDAAIQKRLAENGYRPGGEPPVEFARFVKSETEKYGRIIQTIGLEKN